MPSRPWCGKFGRTRVPPLPASVENLHMTMNSFNSLEHCIKYHREHWGVPGIVVGIYRDGEVSLHAEGIGHLAADWPMRTDNLFRIASITKLFTATAAMMLVDEGSLDLDEPVKTYLPELKLADPEAEATITMRQLLSHAAGIYGDVFDDFGSDDGALTREIAHLETIRQLTKPGELWHYCNSGFDLAGHVIATITGQPYEELIRERLFEPLDMKRAGFFAHEMISWPHAVGHDPVEPLSREHRVANQHYPRNNNPSGAVLTNAGELLLFAAMHIGDGSDGGRQLLKPESARGMREGQIESGDFADEWGIGWDIRDYGDVRLYGHGGSTNGFQSQLTIYPERQFALCIWTNSGHGRLAINPIEAWIIEQEFGLTKREPETTRLGDADLQRLAGTWRQPLGEIRIEIENGGLRLHPRGPASDAGGWVDFPEATARPVDRDRFLINSGPGQGEVLNFFPRDAETPTFLRRHGRLFEREV